MTLRVNIHRQILIHNNQVFFDSWGHGYTCDVQAIKISSTDDCELTNVTGAHESGKANIDVLFFHTYAKNFFCFPKNLKNVFVNVDKIHFYQANFTTLTRSDLQPFGSQLKKFWFFGGDLEVIPAELFADTVNLEWIFLDDNKIKHVGKGTFTKLTKLTALCFRSNPCHSGYSFNRDGVVNLIAQVNNKCTDEEAHARFVCGKQIDAAEVENKRLNAEKSTLQALNEALNFEVVIQSAKIIKLQLELEAEKIKNFNFSCNETTIDNTLNEELSRYE